MVTPPLFQRVIGELRFHLPVSKTAAASLQPPHPIHTEEIYANGTSGLTSAA